MFGDDPRLHEAIFKALRLALGLPSATASAHLLRAYAAPPPPQAEREENLCFYHLTPDVSAPLLREMKVQSGRAHYYRFLPYQLFLVCYGPEAETWALRARENLFVDGAANPLGILRKAGLYLLPTIHPPSVVWEESGSLYRKRADLALNARLLDNSDTNSAASRPLTAETVAAAPAVIPTVQTD